MKPATSPIVPVHYYNEIDPYAAAWLRNLIAAGVLPEGHVDERDIRDILPSDLAGYTSCHFFAGVGGWAYALRLAGWPDDRPVWTGSCPCQPFSAAGKGGGFADERHLWPAWFWLLVQCQPAVVFGEQVDKAVDWLDLVATDLEGEGYAFGAVVLPAAGIGAPHGRHRLWFVADANLTIASNGGLQRSGRLVQPAEEAPIADELVYAENLGHERGRDARPRRDGLTYTDSDATAPLGNAVCERRPGEPLRLVGASHQGPATFWSDCDWLYCRDGKYRPVEPGTFPLAHGIPNRVGRLRAYGNAIVSQVAAEVIKAYLAIGEPL